MTSLGVIFLVGSLVTLAGPGHRILWLLSASAAFPTTAAITMGTSSVAPFHLVAMFVLLRHGGLIFRRAEGPLRRMKSALVGFLVVATLATLIAPVAFPDVLVLSPSIGIDLALLTPTTLQDVSGSVAQIVYVWVSVGVVLILAQFKNLPRRLPEAAFCTGLIFSSAGLFLSDQPWYDAELRNFAGAGYNPFEQRHYGVFPEPSYLASFCVSALVYFVVVAILKTGRRRVGSLLWAALAAVNLLAAASGTAIAALVVLAAGAGLIGVYRLVSGRAPLPVWLPPAVGMALVALAVPNRFSSAIWDLVAEKSVSESALSRFSADLFTLDLVWQTWGLGVGLGSHRPSSFGAAVLGASGVVGAVLLAWALVLAFRSVAPDVGLAVGASLAALVASKLVAEPDLSTPLLWVLLGVAANLASRVSSAVPPSSLRQRQESPTLRLDA